MTTIPQEILRQRAPLVRCPTCENPVHLPFLFSRITVEGTNGSLLLRAGSEPGQVFYREYSAEPNPQPLADEAILLPDDLYRLADQTGIPQIESLRAVVDRMVGAETFRTCTDAAHVHDLDLNTSWCQIAGPRYSLVLQDHRYPGRIEAREWARGRGDNSDVAVGPSFVVSPDRHCESLARQVSVPVEQLRIFMTRMLERQDRDFETRAEPERLPIRAPEDVQW